MIGLKDKLLQEVKQLHIKNKELKVTVTPDEAVQMNDWADTAHAYYSLGNSGGHEEGLFLQTAFGKVRIVIARK